MELGQSGTDEVDGDPGGNQSYGGWVFPALLATVLLVSAVIVLGDRQPGPQSVSPETTANWTPSDEPHGSTVALEIDFGNGAKWQFAALPWQAGMTVAQLMEVAREFRPGIEFDQQGEGAGGLLTAIDGLKNEGSGGRNWRYRVDDHNGEVSFCLQPIEPGMRVLWEFATGD
ncbi:MAG: hypothetical protein IH831_08835 [Planctomycetes bacterium]|nr:hypothetical protein [Planctomycetota bacterium]